MGDTIYRQDAIQTAERMYKRCDTGSIKDYHDLLIEALTALPSEQLAQDLTNSCTDTISRWEAINLIERMKPYQQDADDIAEMIHNMPSAQSGWIPWDSGMFPEESGTYTVTAYDGATKRVTYAKYQKRLKRWELTGSRAYWKVLAWCELPKPWEGGQYE